MKKLNTMKAKLEEVAKLIIYREKKKKEVEKKVE